MFKFFKKKEPLTNISTLPVTTDIHSHILPGIDDGSPDIETSLQLIQGLYDLGIRKSIATPHIIGDLYRNTPEIINSALEKVNAACKNAEINMEISAAAEYMLDDFFLDLLKSKSPLLTLQKNIILTEISYSTAPDNLETIVANILDHGYKPVLAHPERYFYCHHNFDQYHKFTEMGFHLQVNLLSLTGYYGNGAKKAAKFILENNLTSLVGTDLHHFEHLAAFKDPQKLSAIHKYLKDKPLNDINSLATSEY